MLPAKFNTELDGLNATFHDLCTVTIQFQSGETRLKDMFGPQTVTEPLCTLLLPLLQQPMIPYCKRLSQPQLRKQMSLGLQHSSYVLLFHGIFNQYLESDLEFVKN